MVPAIIAKVVFGKILEAAAKVGAKKLEGFLNEKVEGSGELVGELIESVIKRSPVETYEEFNELPEEDIEKSVLRAEEDLPEILAEYTKQQELTNDLLRTEMTISPEQPKEPFFKWGWRPMAMWALVAMIPYAFVAHPLLMVVMPTLEQFQYTVFMGVFSTFSAFYMGGHTIKEWRNGRKST